jgi:hypothetical protein
MLGNLILRKTILRIITLFAFAACLLVTMSTQSFAQNEVFVCTNDNGTKEYRNTSISRNCEKLDVSKIQARTIPTKDHKKEIETVAEREKREKRSIELKKNLAQSIALARYNCKNSQECEKAFALTQIFISSRADMKIQFANNVIVETYNPTEMFAIGAKAFKTPTGGMASEITLTLTCKGITNLTIDYCAEKLIPLYKAFPLALSAGMHQ